MSGYQNTFSYRVSKVGIKWSGRKCTVWSLGHIFQYETILLNAQLLVLRKRERPLASFAKLEINLIEKYVNCFTVSKQSFWFWYWNVCSINYTQPYILIIFRALWPQCSIRQQKSMNLQVFTLKRPQTWNVIFFSSDTKDCYQIS